MSSPGIVSLLFGGFKSQPPTIEGGDDDSLFAHSAARPVLHPISTSDDLDESQEIVAADAATGADDEGMDAPSAAVIQFVDEVKQLPLFSSTAMQLMKSVDDEDASADELARLISCDIGLVAQLLRIVNSPYYGLPKPCATVTAAIAVLGLDAVRRGVMASITQRPLMAYLHDTRAVHAFWRHQMLCAALARHLAIHEGLDGETAYMAGLMHEIGRLVILIKHPHMTDLLLGFEGDDEPFTIEDERTHFGFDHAEIGGALLARWGMPEAIATAVDEHEHGTQPVDAMSAVVWRANRLVHEMADEPEDIAEPSAWMTEINLSLDDRRRMFDEIAALGGQG